MWDEGIPAAVTKGKGPQVSEGTGRAPHSCRGTVCAPPGDTVNKDVLELRLTREMQKAQEGRGRPHTPLQTGDTATVTDRQVRSARAHSCWLVPETRGLQWCGRRPDGGMCVSANGEEGVSPRWGNKRD